jgi:hypothetical protein
VSTVSMKPVSARLGIIKCALWQLRYELVKFGLRPGSRSAGADVPV